MISEYATNCCTYGIIRCEVTVGRADNAIHNRLAVLRVERGLTRQAFAEELGVNYQTVGYIERGDYHPSLELTLRIAELFGLPVEAVFSRRPFQPLSTQLYGSREVDGGGEGHV